MKKKTDGFYHQINAIIVLIVCCTISIATRDYGWALGGLLGLFIDPDLDHEWLTTAEARIKKLFGSFIGKLFQLYWSPYHVFFRHRSPWTHGTKGLGFLTMIFVATPIRMLYAFWWLIPLGYKFDLWSVYSSLPLLTIAVGWCLQDFVHWLRDFM